MVLLHRFNNDSVEFMALSNWCKVQNWRFVHNSQIMGSEASVVILYDCEDDDTEMFSRAKNCLIIVHE